MDSYEFTDEELEFLLEDETDKKDALKSFKPIRFVQLTKCLSHSLLSTKLLNKEQLIKQFDCENLGDLCIKNASKFVEELFKATSNWANFDATHNVQELSFFSILQKYLGLNIPQTILVMPLIKAAFSGSCHTRVKLEDLLEIIHVHPAEKYSIQNDLIYLQLREIVFVPSNRETLYDLHSNVLQDLMSDSPSENVEDPLAASILNLVASLEKLENDWISDGMRMDAEHITKCMVLIKKRYQHFKLIKKLSAKTSNDSEFAFLLLTIAASIREGHRFKRDDSTIPDFMRKLGRKSKLFNAIQDQVLEGNHWVVQEQWMYSKQGNFRSTSLVLNDFIWEWVYGKNQVKVKMDLNQLYGNLVIPHKNLKPKALFFDTKLKERLGQIENICRKENFKKLSEKLQANQLNKGLTCILYGAPGTGKTQFVKNIASATKRDIIAIDSAAIRSSYYGQSESNLKSLFHKYRTYIDNTGKYPIILLNEADQLLYSRGNENSEHQTSENLINLLLDALENFEGILFATSNLSTRFDPAFERRFLYKIELGQPNRYAIEKIWKEHFNWLTTVQCSYLVQEFKISPSLIENVKKDFILSSFLEDDSKPNFNLLVELTTQADFNFNKFK